jgi:hypothetical protein
MGDWGYDTFENDNACDWLFGLEDVDDLSLVTETFEHILAVGPKLLVASDAEEGLAACEVVARLKGHYGQRDAYTEDLDQWVKSHRLTPSPDLIQTALAVIARVLTPPSELLDLWEESDLDQWKQAVENLRGRVAG